MSKFFSPEKAARFSAKHPWMVVGVWVLIIVAAMAGASLHKSNSGVAINTKTESGRAAQQIKDARGAEPATETIVVSSATNTADSADFKNHVEDLTRRVRTLNGTVAQAVSYYDVQDASMVSADGHKALIAVTLAGKPEDAKDTVVPLLATVKDANVDGYSVLTVGGGSLNQRNRRRRAERPRCVPRSSACPPRWSSWSSSSAPLVAAGVPMMLSIVAIIVAVGLTGVVSNFVRWTTTCMNMIIMIGLAVGIDYTLFIVERFREERARGLAKIDAITRAGATASRAVLFSGITVIIALSGLLIMPAGSFTGMALGAIAAAAGAVLAAMTLLPAVALAAGRQDQRHPPAGPRQGQDRRRQGRLLGPHHRRRHAPTR